MRYENIKTGAVIDSLYPVKGGDWIPVSNENKEITDATEQELKSLVLEQQEKINQLEDEVHELKQRLLEAELDEETVHEEHEDVVLEDLTIEELETLAKDQKVELTAKDKKNKETRIAAIKKALG